jgi:hypothetical protein
MHIAQERNVDSGSMIHGSKELVARNLQTINVAFCYERFGGENDRPRIPNAKILLCFLSSIFGNGRVIMVHSRELEMYDFECAFTARDARRISADLRAYQKHHIIHGYCDILQRRTDVDPYANLNGLLTPFIERLMTPEERHEQEEAFERELDKRDNEVALNG